MKKNNIFFLLLSLVALATCQPTVDKEACYDFIRKDNWCNEFDTLNYLSYKMNYRPFAFYNKGRSLMSDSMSVISKKQRADTLVIGFMHFTHMERRSSSSSFYNGWSPFYDLVCNLYYVKDTIVKVDIFPCSGQERTSHLVGKTNAQLMDMDRAKYEEYVKTVHNISSSHFKKNWKIFHKGY